MQQPNESTTAFPAGASHMTLLILQEFRALRADIKAFRDEIHSDLCALKNDLKRWNDEAAHAG